MAVKLPLKRRQLYRKPSSEIADFTECIESMFSCIKVSIYLCGDFNIDLLNYDVNNSIKYC